MSLELHHAATGTDAAEILHGLLMHRFGGTFDSELEPCNACLVSGRLSVRSCTPLPAAHRERCDRCFGLGWIAEKLLL